MAEDGEAVATGSNVTSVVIASVVVVVVSVLVKVVFFSKRRNLKLPPGPKGWPIVGTLFETRGPKTHKILIDLAKKFGPIYNLQTGLKDFVIVTDPEITHEALVKEGKQYFSSRPKLLSRLNYTGWRSVNSALDGPYWRGIRKNLVSHVLSTKQVASFAPFREEELDTLLQRVRAEAARNDDVVQILPHCRFTVFSILLHVCFGQKFEPEVIEELDEILKRLLVILAPQVIDFLPFVQPFSKHRAECQQLLGRVRKLFGPLIENHRKLIAEGKGPGDYVESLLNLQKDKDLKVSDTDALGLIGEVLTGGTDTTANTLEWAMGNILQQPEIQTKLYEEIKQVAGDRPVSEKDVDSMPYLQAVVKEALRKHPSLPFGITHGVTQQCKLRGYDIPEDAMVLFHYQAIQNDPKYWDKPEEFRPERFLKPNVNHDMTGSHGVESMYFLPFGVGRRICPGMSLGLKHAHLILARLIQTFEWSRVNPEQDVNFDEELAFTIVMTNPLFGRVRERTA